MSKSKKPNKYTSMEQRLIGATILGAVTFWAPAVGYAQDAATNDSGFVFAINGVTVDADPRIVDAVRQADVALAQADIRVVFDGLGAKPRLDLEIVGAPNGYDAGERVTFQSALNYPAYVERAEVRIIDLGTTTGKRTVAVLDVAPNGQASMIVPEGRDLVAVHRVYDAAGRYDETAPVTVSRPDGRRLVDGVEDGSDGTTIRRIPVYGGAVTVSGSSVVPGATINALGETLRPDPRGNFVIQRILPAGEYDVDVQVTGVGNANVGLTRPIEIPGSEWFYLATADLTFGLRETGGDRSSYANGRLAFFADGKTSSGYRITASADAADGPLRDVFRRLDDTGPLNILDRVDPADLYPTYGDDSTSEDRTPTSGRFFIRIERENNFAQWGDFKSTVTGNEYLRNERALYGLSTGYETRAQTSRGEARIASDLYVAQPDMAAERDVFRGSGGSVYFLKRQDIGRASETLTVQVRDHDTGRVIETRRLIAGNDYTINYIQGIITLARPLQGSAGGGLITDGTQTDHDVQLIAQYEYVPTVGDLDGRNYGARTEGWITDQVRVGVTGFADETGTENQTAISADVLYQLSEDTFLRADYARSEGPGFGSSISADGGLIIENNPGVAGRGEAYKVSGQALLSDLGIATDGSISGYFEERTAGFSTLDYQVSSDETLWGVATNIEASERLRFKLYYDALERDDGTVKNKGGAELGYHLTNAITLDTGVERVQREGTSEAGERTDVAAKLSYALNDEATVYLFGQNSIDVSGLDRNDRYGAGFEYGFATGWTATGELSDGTNGVGGRLAATYTDATGNTRYLGYELETSRTLPGVILDGRDRGRIVAGGRQQVTGSVTIFGENTYDVFGRHRTQTAAYGATYTVTDALSYSAAFEMGRVDDDADNEFDRRAISVGMGYDTERLVAAARLEYRTDEGLRSGDEISTETALVSGRLSYQVNDAHRLLASAKLLQTTAPNNAILDGDFVDVTLGYAMRPVDNERLNILARLRYLHDDIGQRIDGVDGTGPRQHSGVFSINASYDVTQNWTLGGKLGYRTSETAADATSEFVQNDAWIAIANARYNLVKDWDVLLEVRSLGLVQDETQDSSFLGAVYKQVGPNAQIGVGYNFGTFSDDLTDLTRDDQGVFINLVAQF